MIVSRVAATALALLNQQKQDKRTPGEIAIQAFIDSNPFDCHTPAVCKLLGLMTTFEPNPPVGKGMMFSVFKATNVNNPDKFWLTVSVKTGKPNIYGFNRCSTGYRMWDNNCVPATREEADQFIKSNIANVDDADLIDWFVRSLGSIYVKEMMLALK